MTKVSESLKSIVRKRAGNSCEKCGTKIVRFPDGSHNGTFHHRFPQRLHIVNTIPNLVLLCLDCHREIHRTPANEFLASRTGWICWVDPEMTPVFRRGQRWALLVPDGSLEPLVPREGERLLDWMNGEARTQSA